MKQHFDTNWTENEFLTYLYIYCMNADYEESSKEISFVKSKTSDEVFEKMHEEFEEDNDYASVQKIVAAHKRLGYTKADDAQLIEGVKELLLLDKEYHIEEKNLIMILKHLFS